MILVFVLALGRKVRAMIIYVKTEDKKSAFVIPDDTDFSTMIERDYQERLAAAGAGEKVTRRTPQEIMDDVNKATYNAGRGLQRYRGFVKTPFRREGEMPLDGMEAVAEGTEYLGSGLTISGTMSAFERWESALHMEEVKRDLKEILKPDAYDMAIKIGLEGMKPGAYAMLIGDKPNNVSKRWNRVKKLILKYLLTQAPELVKHWKK